MNTVHFENPTGVKMIAHRGVSGLERENTCPAFVAAGVKSYWGIETDVHVTADGHYILHHDANTLRLTGQNLEIKRTDLATLRALRMLDLDGKTARNDLFFPTAEEYLAICKKYGKAAVLELKGQMRKRDVCGIATAVAEMGMLEQTVFIAFCGQNLLYLRSEFPNATAQYLTADASERSLSFMVENGLDADLDYRSVTPEFVSTMHANGRVVNAWTVNELADAARLASYGIDMITSNILE